MSKSAANTAATRQLLAIDAHGVWARGLMLTSKVQPLVPRFLLDVSSRVGDFIAGAWLKATSNVTWLEPRPTVADPPQAAPLGADVSTILESSIVCEPELRWVDGILWGTLGATSTRGLPLRHKVVGQPSLGGRIIFSTNADPWDRFPYLTNPAGNFLYLPCESPLDHPGRAEQFSVRVHEWTRTDAFLASIPILGWNVPSLLDALYRIPRVNQHLATIIGRWQVVSFNEIACALAGGRSTAFTYKIACRDRALVPVHYVPPVKTHTGDSENRIDSNCVREGSCSASVDEKSHGHAGNF